MQTKETIKEVLKNYHALEIKRKVFASAGKTSPEIALFTLIQECIASLGDESRDIIEKVYVHGMTIREYAKRNYISHTTVIRKINAAVEVIAECCE